MDEERVIDAMTAGIEPAEKVKAFAPQIVVSGKPGTPYYNISWYDVVKRVWYIGYGSYNIEFVRKWLRECFEEVEVDMVEAVRCKDCKHLVLTEEGNHNPNDCVCDYWMTDGLKDDDFCSNGERRENEAD
jgi:hypothetical protein